MHTDPLVSPTGVTTPVKAASQPAEPQAPPTKSPQVPEKTATASPQTWQAYCAVAPQPASGEPLPPQVRQLTPTDTPPAILPPGIRGQKFIFDQDTSLPHHAMQTPPPHYQPVQGTLLPVQRDCNTTALHNMFNFFGLKDQALGIDQAIHTMLQDIEQHGAKNLHMGKVRKAFNGVPRWFIERNDFETGDPEKAEALKPVYTKLGVTDRTTVADLVTSAIKQKQTDGIFYGQSPQKVKSASLNTTTLTFLSQIGAEPETVMTGKSGTPNAAQKVLAALDAGKPVLIGDHGRFLAGDKPQDPNTANGHAYLLYKHGDRYELSDSAKPHPIPFVKDSPMYHELLLKLENDTDTRATIIHGKPSIPARWRPQKTDPTWEQRPPA